jgi:hypothetical protein
VLDAADIGLRHTGQLGELPLGEATSDACVVCKIIHYSPKNLPNLSNNETALIRAHRTGVPHRTNLGHNRSTGAALASSRAEPRRSLVMPGDLSVQHRSCPSLSFRQQSPAGLCPPSAHRTVGTRRKPDSAGLWLAEAASGSIPPDYGLFRLESDATVEPDHFRVHVVVLDQASDELGELGCRAHPLREHHGGDQL